MSGTLAIGSGLAQGLAKVLLGKRQRDQDDEIRRGQQQSQTALSAIGMLLQSGKVADYSQIQPLFDLALGIGGPGAKKSKKGEPNPHDILSHILTPAFGHGLTSAPTQGVAEDGNRVPAAAMGEHPTLPSRAAVAPTTPPAPPPTRQSLFGVDLLSDEEIAARNRSTLRADTQVKTEAEYDAKQALVTRAVANGWDRKRAEQFFGIAPPPDRMTVPAGATVLEDNTPVFTAPTKVDPVNWQRIEGVIEGEPASQRRAFFVNPETREITEQDGTKVTGTVMDAQPVDPNLAETRELRNSLLRLQTNAGGLTPSQVVNETQQLREAWQKHIQPIVERREAVARVDTAVAALATGERLAAADAILVAFQKLNDERTGVREGEVQRIMNGLGLPSRITGALQRLQRDGAAIPDDQLRSLGALAKATATEMDKVREAELSEYRSAIEDTIGQYGIPSARIFGRSAIGVSPSTAGGGAEAGAGARSSTRGEEATRRVRARQAIIESSNNKSPTDQDVDAFLQRNPTFR